jgi:hypothetical protein
MSSPTSTVSVTDRPAPDRTTVTAAALIGAVGCAGYISTLFLLSDLTIREAARSPLTIASNLIVAIAFAVLAASLPGLRHSTALPGWALIVTAVGCAGITATAWATGTLAVHAAGLLTESQMEQTSIWFDLFQGPQVLPCTVGFLALAIGGWRHHAIPRGAAALLGVAGVLSVVPAYPPGAIVGALAIAWTAHSAAPRPARREGR